MRDLWHLDNMAEVLNSLTCQGLHLDFYCDTLKAPILQPTARGGGEGEGLPLTAGSISVGTLAP